MSYYLTEETCRIDGDPPSENRVVGLDAFTFSCTWSTWSQTPDTHPEIETTDTTTVSGILSWPSRDPIQEKGGANLYSFVRNCPVCLIDPLGLEECCRCVSATITDNGWVIQHPSPYPEHDAANSLGLITYRVGRDIQYDFETEGGEGCSFSQSESGSMSVSRWGGGGTVLDQSFDGSPTEIDGDLTDLSGFGFLNSALGDGQYNLNYNLSITIKCTGEDGSSAEDSLNVNATKSFRVTGPFVTWMFP